MTDRYRGSDQNRRSMAFSRTGSANIQPLGHSERMGTTSLPTKILRPISSNIEVLLRARDESEVEEVTICQPYERDKAELHTPYVLQNLKNTYQKPLELTFDDEMYSSSVIGWSLESHNTVLINKTFLGITSEDIVPLTHTIFPVMVMGWNELPVLNEPFHRDFYAYGPGFYLILRYHNIKTFTAQIEVHKGSTHNKFRVQTSPALLEIFNFHVLSGKKLYKSVGIVHRILDKDNTSYGIYGMYGGGPLPPGDPRTSKKYRLTWDQPRSMGSEEFGLSSMETNFRYNVDYQRFSQRIGFFCSRDALLSVSEKIEDPNEGPKIFRSLLKEFTFVIIDGNSNYGLFHSEGTTQWVSFRNMMDQMSAPIIVIVPEGISSLRVIENKGEPLHRNSKYYNQNSTLPPMVINWKVFQNDFNGNARIAQIFPTGMSSQASATVPQQGPEYTGLQQIMNLRDFRNYVMYPIPSLGTVYVFCLRESPRNFPDKNALIDSWHIYCKLSDQTVDNMSAIYYYLGSINFSYNYRPYLKYSQMFFLRLLFTPQISSQYSVTQTEQQRAQQMVAEYQQIRKNREFMRIIRNLIHVDISHLNNPTNIAQTRQQTIDLIKNGYPD